MIDYEQACKVLNAASLKSIWTESSAILTYYTVTQRGCDAMRRVQWFLMATCWNMIGHAKFLMLPHWNQENLYFPYLCSQVLTQI